MPSRWPLQWHIRDSLQALRIQRREVTLRAMIEIGLSANGQDFQSRRMLRTDGSKKKNDENDVIKMVFLLLGEKGLLRRRLFFVLLYDPSSRKIRCLLRQSVSGQKRSST